MKFLLFALGCVGWMAAGSLPAADAPPDSPPPAASPPIILVPSPTAERHLAAYLNAKTGTAMADAFDVLQKEGRAAVNAMLSRLRAELEKPTPDGDAVNRLDHALVKLGKPALPAVVALVRDPGESVPVRAEAARILSSVQGNRAVLALVEILVGSLEQNPSPFGARLVEVLGDLGDPRPLPSLERALEHEDASVRFAAATALGKLQNPSAIPALINALKDPDVAVRAAANRALVRLTGVDQGYRAEESDVERAVDAAKWGEWWEKNEERVKPRLQNGLEELWKHADEALAWAVAGRPIPGMNLTTIFPGPHAPEGTPIYVSTGNLPPGLMPLVEGRRVVLLNDPNAPIPKEGYWGFEEPKMVEGLGQLTIIHLIPGQQPETATLQYAKTPGGGWGYRSALIGKEKRLESGVPIPPAKPQLASRRTASRPKLPMKSRPVSATVSPPPAEMAASHPPPAIRASVGAISPSASSLSLSSTTE